MNDQPAHPPAAPNEDKPAPPSSPAGKIALPKSQVHTATQHIFIWTMVVVVGVLFGMGGTMGALQNKPRLIGGKVEESEILLRSNTAKKLQDMINPSRRPHFADYADVFEKTDGQQSMYEQWARDIQEARIAEAQGLLPGGAALEAIKADFLNHPLEEGSARRFADAMREHRGGDKELTSEELGRFLAERTAVELLLARNVVAPALPPALADIVASFIGDKVEADELVLDAKHLLAKVADDDAEIQTTYDALRSARFGRPRAVTVSIAYADTKALAEKAVVSPAEVEKYYAAHKEQYKLPPKPVVAPKPGDPAKPGEAAKPPAPPAPNAPEYRALSEVSAEITATLKKQQAEEKAHQLVLAFNDAATDLENQKDNAGFKAAAAKGGLLVKENVLIEDPGSGGTLKVGDFGELSEGQLRLFGQEVNFLFSPIQSTGANPAWVLLRLDGKREAGFRELKDAGVRSEVMAALAGKRAYKDLLKEAEAARAAAEKLGQGGLKKYAASDAAKPWAATLTSHPQPATTELRAPPAELGAATPAEPRMIASLALLSAPVMLASAPSEGAAAAEDVPRVRLVQVTGYTAAPALAGDDRVRDLGMLQRVVEGYRRNLYYNSELRPQLGK
jgi:hypothetical protein